MVEFHARSAPGGIDWTGEQCLKGIVEFHSRQHQAISTGPGAASA
jgi:hypothetical protein